MQRDHVWWKYYELVGNYGGWYKVGANSAFYDRCLFSKGYKRQDPVINKGCDCRFAVSVLIPDNGAASWSGPYQRFEFYDNYRSVVSDNSGWIFGSMHWEHAQWDDWTGMQQHRKDYGAQVLVEIVSGATHTVGPITGFAILSTRKPVPIATTRG